MSIFILLLIHVAFVKFDKSSEVLYQKIVAAIYISSTYPKGKRKLNVIPAKNKARRKLDKANAAFLPGAYLNVRDQRKTQVQHSIA